MDEQLPTPLPTPPNGEISAGVAEKDLKDVNVAVKRIVVDEDLDDQYKSSQPPVERTRPSKQRRPAPKQPLKRMSSNIEEKLVEPLCKYLVDHQIGIAANLLILLSLTHIMYPRARSHTRQFFSLPYYNPTTGRYAAGWADLRFVVFWITIFTGLRVILMEYVFHPLASKVNITKKKEKVRFAEQAWMFFYWTLSACLGTYIFYNSNYWMRLENMWLNWPEREASGLLKWYYLVQFAFWLQQIFVINIEERRSDHWQMFTHHIVTCILMFFSYGYHQMRVGNVVLCLMDSVDTLLPLAKMLKYAKKQTACDVTFGIFMVSWFFLRHVCYIFVVAAIMVDQPRMINYGCYRGSPMNIQGPLPVPSGWSYLIEPFRDPAGLVCMYRGSERVFVALLLGLQAILLVWFSMIVRLAYKVLRGQPAEDVRSDDEEEEEKEMVREVSSSPPRVFAPLQKSAYEDALPIEEEVLADAIDFGRRFRSGGSGAGTGISLPSDRKELLGRIGCDKNHD